MKPYSVLVAQHRDTGRAEHAGADRLHAQRDARETTAPARAAFLARFEHMVDPDGVLPEPERQRRAMAARKRTSPASRCARRKHVENALKAATAYAPLRAATGVGRREECWVASDQGIGSRIGDQCVR